MTSIPMRPKRSAQVSRKRSTEAPRVKRKLALVPGTEEHKDVELALHGCLPGFREPPRADPNLLIIITGRRKSAGAAGSSWRSRNRYISIDLFAARGNLAAKFSRIRISMLEPQIAI
jgi:hypothetical protein